MSGPINANPVNINDNCFDIIRLLCAFTVFLGHFLTHFQVQNSFLHEAAYFVRGVPVFFLLSGLFVARSLERYRIGEFAKRRICRIFPELWVCVLVNLALIIVSIKGGYALRDICIYLVTQLTIFQFYTGDWLAGYGVGVPNGALWTITVDIQFYIVAIFIAKLMKKRSLNVWGIVILLALALDFMLEKGKGVYPEIWYKLLQVNLVPFLWIFLIGMCAYYNREKLVPVCTKIKWITATAYLIWQYAIPSAFTGFFDGIRYNLITTLLLTASVLGVGFSYTKRLAQDYSYSFYLYHMVVINFVVQNLWSTFDSVGQFLGTFIASSAAIGILAVLSRKFIGGNLTKKIERRLL